MDQVYMRHIYQFDNSGCKAVYIGENCNFSVALEKMF